MRRHHRYAIPIILILALLPLAGCDDHNVRLGPMAPAGPLFVQSNGSATQIEPNDGFRIQVRMRVISGLDLLDQAARSGAASGEVCVGSLCESRSLSTSFGEGVCAGVATMPTGDGARFGIAVAWIEGEAAGIDFCIENLVRETTFDTTVSDGLNFSNAIRTTCTPGGTCFSG